MSQLEKIEIEILQRREAYNHAVEQYNAYRVRLPQAPLASICNFEEAPYFEASSSDLDVLAEFKTGDTKAVEAVLRRASGHGRLPLQHTRIGVRVVKSRAAARLRSTLDHLHLCKPAHSEVRS